ncbi:MAG: ABC transporter permease, partial [Desulfomonilia bacterium]|nr:ABC transporter permease [Desulfomonilia bacterium]
MIRETILLALRAIRRNIMRSTLTILGIIIGVAAVITMVTLGGGATAQVTSEISSLGTNMLQLRPGQGFRGPGGTRSAAEGFTIEDASAISREIFGLEAVAPTATGRAQAIFGNRNWSTTVMGVTNEFLQVRDWSLSNGRLFSSGELQAGRTVCILGATVSRELFGEQDPTGARIRLQKLSCQVIGVLEPKGLSGFGQDQDDTVLIPLRAFQRRIRGNTDVTTIYVSAVEGISTAAIQKDIERLMRERRNISP